MTYEEIKIENELRESARNKILENNYPDAHDGLTSVEREILYTLYKYGNPTISKQSALLIWQTMQYVPFDAELLYSVIIKFVQDFKTKYPLLIGVGDFGTKHNVESVSYLSTSVKLSNYGIKMFSEMKYKCVDFTKNYDSKEIFPVTLPAEFPHLLCNGSDSIPGHNIKNVQNALLSYIENPNITCSKLTEIIGTPKFADGRILLGKDFSEYYETGRQDFQYKIKNSDEIKVFEANNTVLCNGEKKLFNIKELISEYVRYRQNIVNRKLTIVNGKEPNDMELKESLIKSIELLK